MRQIFFLCLFCAPLLLFAANLPPGFVEVPLATGLDPTAMAQAPDGRIFITEKYGAVRIVENGVLLPDPFLLLNVDNYNERGLSGIALDPDFAQNGYVYLYYTVSLAGHNRLSRVRALGNYAIPGSEEILLELDPLPGTIHNAGAMVFGEDGKLYLAVGEGADGTKAPKLNTLLGKILRLNPDGTVPADNPYYDQLSGIHRAIYATGLRNPFSMAIQPGTQRIFVCDVGSSFFEEINAIEAGKDYGWNLLEGKQSNQQVPDNYRDPLYTYPHSIGCAAVGAAFFNPASTSFPANYTGKFFFGDYCNKKISTLDPATGQVTGTFASNINRPLAIMTGREGDLYYISRGGLGGGSEEDNTSSKQGILWRVSYVGNGAPVFSVQPYNVLIPVGEDAHFSVQANGSPTIQYQWQRNGIDIPGATSPDLLLSAVLLADSGVLIRCLAENPFGQVSSQEAVLRVTGNQRPLPVILTPDDLFRYAAGDTIRFSGQATDPETGLLADDDLTWRLDLHHDQHTHPGLGPIEGLGSGVYVVPRIGETDDNVWLRIYLTARDPIGLTQTVYRDVFPLKTRLRLESSPAGLPMRVDGKTYTTPFEINSVKGMLRQIEAQPSFSKYDTMTVFTGWTDGENNFSRVVYAEDALTTLHANYEDAVLRGTGAYGMYYTLTADTTFGNLVFTQLDTTINFAWGNGAPDPRLGSDFFGVRWLAYVEPLFTEDFYFHVDSDDGFRLWVDGQLIADEWRLKGPGEVSTPVFLEKGRRYAIELAYFEWGGGASAKLSWSSASLPKRVIHRVSLFPRLPENPGYAPNKFEISVYPNPIRHLLNLRIEADYQEPFDARLFDAQGRMIREWRQQEVDLVNEQFSWPVSDLPAGMYWLEITRQRGPKSLFPLAKG